MITIAQRIERSRKPFLFFVFIDLFSAGLSRNDTYDWKDDRQSRHRNKEGENNNHQWFDGAHHKRDLGFRFAGIMLREFIKNTGQVIRTDGDGRTEFFRE